MRKTIARLAVLTATLGFAAPAHAAGDIPVFELRIYTAMPGKLDAVLARFRDHTCRMFARHGMVNLGYWVPADAKDGAGEKLVYLLAHPSREAANAAWTAFRADPEWQAVRAASEANGKIVAKTESVFLAATDYAPAFAPGAGNGAAPRIFELRTYTTPEGGLAALDARFRGGETDLFVKSGMTRVTFTHPLDADQGAGHTLIYLLAHANREAAIASWKAFRENPAWVKMKADSEKAAGGPLTTKTVSLFLSPADFSPTK
jgi:hypothetical protein